MLFKFLKNIPYLLPNLFLSHSARPASDQCGVYDGLTTFCLGRTGIKCDRKIPGDKLHAQRMPISDIQVNYKNGRPIAKVIDKTFNGAKYGSDSFGRKKRSGGSKKHLHFRKF